MNRDGVDRWRGEVSVSRSVPSSARSLIVRMLSPDGMRPHLVQVVEHMKELKREFKDCLRMLSAVRETFEDRAQSLLHYEIMTDRYDEVVRRKGRR